MNEQVGAGTASIVFAAGKGSRMVGFTGNKTLLPLVAKGSPYEGTQPILLEVLENLPRGPKALVVNYCADDVKQATQGLGVDYILQPVTNGTGGALLVSRGFIESEAAGHWVITMGDVPLIRPSTYASLIEKLDAAEMVLLGFAPEDKAQYGLIEMDGARVLRIVEWKYWSAYPPERQESLRFCNAGVYAVRRHSLLKYLGRLSSQPHRVRKQRGDAWVTIEEYFLTDLVEMMGGDGLPIGLVVVEADEVVGVDTPDALRFVQGRYASRIEPSPKEASPQ
jgi:bifunctional UDP-N-acetylglucosamine pyrophosphorylase / glucosamine-1-phosphate N-acetyltransferase